MGQHNYDDDDEEAYTPRRIWPTPPRYVARVLAPREYPPVAVPAHPARSHASLLGWCGLGLVVFTCSAASLVIVALYMDSALGQVRDAAYRITGVLEVVSDNSTRLARLAALMEAWLGNTTLAGAPLSPGGY
jgi:hypothetical protein